MMATPGREKLQKGIIILPSAFTLANLFFGFYAIVATTRGEFEWAGWFVVWAGVLDMLDGRIARFTRTGSAFGAELDSLVDAISFGVAPAFIMYTLFFSDGAWSWVLPFAYVTAVVVRLARFNVEQGGEAKKNFHGLPSPTSGMILATYHPFSQTAFFQDTLSVMLPWPTVIGVLMILLSALLLSHVPYPMVPKISLSSPKGVLTSAWLFGNMFLALTVPEYHIFPILVLYTAWGLLASVIHGLVDRLPDRDPLLDVADEDLREEVRTLDYTDIAPQKFTNPPENSEN
jgi:CDP-diacylglycerol---serine O-phosphatidyltransferase